MMDVKFKKEFRPPLRCRVFKHRFKETVYEVPVLGDVLSSNLYVCPHCGLGRVQAIGRLAFIYPEDVHTFIRRHEMKAVEKEGDVVEGNFNEQG